MNVAAEEEPGLVFFDEFADRAAAGVHSIANLVQGSAVRGAVADQDQRLQTGEPLQTQRDFLLGEFPRRVEWRWAGISQSRDVITARFDTLLVKIVEAVSPAER